MMSRRHVQLLRLWEARVNVDAFLRTQRLVQMLARCVVRVSVGRIVYSSLWCSVECSLCFGGEADVGSMFFDIWRCHEW